MSVELPPPPHVIHLTGRDEPGLLASLTEIVTSSGAPILELTQSVLHGNLSLSFSVDGATPEVLDAVRHYAEGKGLDCSIQPALPTSEVEPACGVCVTLLGALSGSSPLSRVTRILANLDLDVRQTRSLGAPVLRGMELLVTKKGGGRFPAPDLAELRRALHGLGPDLGVDLAIQRDDFYRRSKRLLCMDVDSTFVRGEFIDELAALAGVKEDVARITERAMRGELDFKAALRERVKLLRGLPMSRALELCDKFELSPGAHDLVRTAKQLGLKVGLVSGGFDFFVEMLRERFRLDFAFANQLEVEDGILTGNVVGTIVDSERKAQVLRDMAHVFEIHLEQTIAVGDGANDILMLQAAGLGIAYQAKPLLQEIADTRFNHHDRLDTLFYLMGYDAPEVTSACR